MKVVVLSPEELQELLADAAEKGAQRALSEYGRYDRVGSVELAHEITGFSLNHIRKLCNDPNSGIPFRRVNGYTLTFHEGELRQWYYPKGEYADLPVPPNLR